VQASTAGCARAWSLATALVLGGSAIGLALGVARTFAAGAPHPVPHRVSGALAAQALALAVAAWILRRAARRGSLSRDGGAWPAFLAAIAAALATATLLDTVAAGRLLEGLLGAHRREVLDAVFRAALALSFAVLAPWSARAAAPRSLESDPREWTRAAKGRPPARPRSLASVALRTTALVTLVAVACEAAVTALAILRPSPLLSAGAEASDKIRAHLLEPGSRRFGFAVNREGFYDDAVVFRPARG